MVCFFEKAHGSLTLPVNQSGWPERPGHLPCVCDLSWDLGLQLFFFFTWVIVIKLGSSGVRSTLTAVSLQP